MNQEKHQLPEFIKSLSDKEKIKLIHALIVPVDRMCPNILANGEPCEKFMEKYKVECTSCHRKKIRKPTNISSEDWEIEKDRRAKARKDKTRERNETNRKRIEELIKSKKLKRY